MTIEEKLQHFYDTSVAEAQTEADFITGYVNEAIGLKL